MWWCSTCGHCDDGCAAGGLHEALQVHDRPHGRSRRGHIRRPQPPGAGAQRLYRQPTNRLGTPAASRSYPAIQPPLHKDHTHILT